MYWDDYLKMYLVCTPMRNKILDFLCKDTISGASNKFAPMEFALESLTQIASNVLAFFDTTIPFYAELEYAIDYFNGTEDVCGIFNILCNFTSVDFRNVKWSKQIAMLNTTSV